MSIHRSQRERSTGMLTRRRFLAGTAAAAASPWLVPASALGKDGATAAGDRITIGVLGVGNRGNSSIDALYPLPDAQVVAIADPRRERRLWTQDQVNATYAKRENKASYKACDAYHDFRELLARPDIDAVWGCVPDHWHGVLYNRVLEAGKDMYGEKPVTRWIGQGVTVCQAVRRYGRVFQTGTQQRSTWQFRHACELARAGYLGKVHSVYVGAPGGMTYDVEPPCDPPEGFDYDFWTGPAPMIPFDKKRCEWLAMYMISHYCAGFITNWGVHHLDIAGWGCPEIFHKPFEVEGKGVLPEGGMTDTWIAWQMTYRWASGLMMSFTNTDNPNKIGCRFEGDQGWVHADRAGIWAEPASLLTVQLKPDDVHLHRSPDWGDKYGYTSHSADFLRCVRTRQDPVSPVEEGHAASTLGNVADIALRLGRKLKWDPAASRFDGDDDANNLLDRPLRSPWTL
ncbi:MAG: Gfo/Idh/MocA family oxidoreductase [Planctomycetia bacterium]|nr:Gfo/Idh/MocA family oxidoreductase [Planctomycetia bacterium]